MASSSLPFHSSPLIKLPPKRNVKRLCFQIKAQRFSDEGSWRGIVDENMSVLMERMKEVKMKERLEKCCRSENGWNYAAGYDHQLKKKMVLSQYFHVVGLSCGSFALTCLCGALFLFLFSLLVNSNH